MYSWGGRSDIAGRTGNLLEPGLLGGALANDTILFVAGGEYFSLAASRHRVYGWGGNDYLSVGVGRNNPVQSLKPGRDRGVVKEPAQVAGALADGTWNILAIAAGEVDDRSRSSNSALQVETVPTCNSTSASYSGFQHSMIIAEKGGSSASSTTTPVRTLVEGGVSAAVENKTMFSADAKPRVTASDLASNTYLYAQIQAKPESISAADIWSHYKQSPKHDQIVAASPDVFASLPEFFSSRFKNPCWFRDRTLHCLPYYHILGVSKCGTTDIYNRLIKHPHIYESLNKGPHWWDECPWPLKGACTAPPKGDFDGYINLFSKVSVCHTIQHISLCLRTVS